MKVFKCSPQIHSSGRFLCCRKSWTVLGGKCPNIQTGCIVPQTLDFATSLCAKRIYHPTYCARWQKRADNQPYRCYWWHRRVLFLWSHIDRSANAHPTLVLAHLSGCLHPHFDFNWKWLFIAWFGGYCNRPICHAAMLSHCTQRLCHASTLWQNLWLSAYLKRLGHPDFIALRWHRGITSPTF